MIVLDTHAVVWWTLEETRLSSKAKKLIANAEPLLVPSIVFWEFSLLVRRGRYVLDMPVAEWARRICEIPRVQVVPLTTDIALLADTLKMHSDPADRFIVATAVKQNAILLTKDALLKPLDFVQTRW